MAAGETTRCGTTTGPKGMNDARRGLTCDDAGVGQVENEDPGSHGGFLNQRETMRR